MVRRRFIEPEWVTARRERLADLDKEFEARRRHLEAVESDLLDRLNELAQANEKPDQPAPAKERHSGWLSNFVIATGLSASVIALGGKIAEDFYFGDEGEICPAAYEAMSDDKPNGGVPDRYMTTYLEKQAKNAIQCANRKLD